MADGFSAHLAGLMLDVLTGLTVYAQVHTGPPGAAGTSNESSFTTRVEVTFAAIADGSVSISADSAFTASWTGTNGEELTDLSFWDAPTGGNYLLSGAMTASQVMHTGDPLDLVSLTIALPVAS